MCSRCIFFLYVLLSKWQMPHNICSIFKTCFYVHQGIDTCCINKVYQCICTALLEESRGKESARRWTELRVAYIALFFFCCFFFRPFWLKKKGTEMRQRVSPHPRWTASLPIKPALLLWHFKCLLIERCWMGLFVVVGKVPSNKQKAVN